jgi:hypothetical protein
MKSNTIEAFLKNSEVLENLDKNFINYAKIYPLLEWAVQQQEVKSSPDLNAAANFYKDWRKRYDCDPMYRYGVYRKKDGTWLTSVDTCFFGEEQVFYMLADSMNIDPATHYIDLIEVIEADKAPVQ